MNEALQILILSLSLNSASIMNSTKYDSSLFSDVFSIVAKDLGLDTAKITITICNAEFNPDINSQGSVNRYGTDYWINIQDLFKPEAIKVFIHELVHVSQSYHNRMRVMKYFVLFEGKAYYSNVPYSERPFEVEAMQLTDQLWSKYRKALKSL